MNETVTPVADVPAPVADASATGKANKSKLILAAFKEHGLDMPANDLIAAIEAKDGVTVTASLINNIKCKLRKKRAERAAKRQKPEDAKPAVENDPLTRLFAVKEFAATVGGLTELKALVGKLEALTAA